MESFVDKVVSAMCASNIVDQHIQKLVNRPDGLLVVLKAVHRDSAQVREKFCAVLRKFADQGHPFRATTESFSNDGFDYMIALLTEEDGQ